MIVSKSLAKKIYHESEWGLDLQNPTTMIERLVKEVFSDCSDLHDAVQWLNMDIETLKKVQETMNNYRKEMAEKNVQ